MTMQPFSTKLPTPDSSAYLERVGIEHRKRYAQYFTHPAVADFMVKWALGGRSTSLYDPCFGLGAFLRPVVGDSRTDFKASEVDPEILRFWATASGSDASFVANEDYLLSWGRRHENIVCNPPYMRFQKFPNRDVVLDALSANLGLRLSGYTNIASAFLLKSLSELGSAGRLAYVMPLEFLNTGYGKPVKARLTEEGHLAAIISLDCEKDVFPDAITSVGIILYDAGAIYPAASFHSVRSLDALPDVLEAQPTARIPFADLNPGAKWLSYFAPTTTCANAGDMVSLEHYGRFSRGIATGANEFFALRPSEARRWGLRQSECVPCITRSAQIRKPFFSAADYHCLVNDDAPILLFSANGALSPETAGYIKFGEANGYHQRFITRNRNPWYKMETRDPAPLFLGVFSRGDYKIIRNQSNAVSLSCFHGFRPNLYGQRYIDHLFLYFLSEAGRKEVARSMRKYGNSLGKFEPNDVNEAYVPVPARFDELKDGDIEEALRLVELTGRVPEYIEAFFAKLA